jgi:hypothetical protein
MRIIFVVLVVGGVAGCGGAGAPLGGCGGDGDCPVHQFCQARACVSGCLSAADCGGASCDPHGRCGGTPPGDDGGGALDLRGADWDLSTAAGQDLSLAAIDLAPPPPDLTYVDAWICTGACPDATLEPNNDSGHATVESDGANVNNLAICPMNDVDVYKITASHHGMLQATLINGPCGAALTMDLLAGDGTTVLASSPSSVTALVNKSDVRFVRVRAAAAGGQNFYALHIGNN